MAKRAPTREPSYIEELESMYDHLHDGPWIEARVVAEPIRGKNFDGTPRLLVKRSEGTIFGMHGEELISLPGEPVISLFTGAGGMDLGMESAGLYSLVQHEYMAEACATLIANRPRAFRYSALIQGDIRKTPTEMLLEAAGLRVGEATIVAGGPPCQGFSVANGNREKGHDERNDLVWEFLRVVCEAKPRFFLMENVPGFCMLNKGEYFKKYLETAYGCFYELVYGLMGAASYGVPQRRVRFFCMGTRRDLVAIDGILGSLPEPTHFSPGDVTRLIEYKAAPLFTWEEEKLLRHAPGIRYFPDRPIIKPPHPVVMKEDDDYQKSHLSDGYLEFWRKLEREEPDRIVREPRHQR